jgi:hypothetical protein
MRKTLLIPVLVVALSVGLATPTRAAPIEGSGTFTFSYGTGILINQAGGNLFVNVPFTAINTGILTGSCAGSYALLLHLGGTTLIENFTGSETCTGAVDSRAGTYSMSFAGTQAAGAPFEGNMVLSGTGTLANLQGQGTFQEKAFGHPTFANYTVAVLFAL